MRCLACSWVEITIHTVELVVELAVCFVRLHDGCYLGPVGVLLRKANRPRSQKGVSVARPYGLLGQLLLTSGHIGDYLRPEVTLGAAAYGVRHIFEYMREAGGGGERLVAVGGGTKGGLWTQIVSDVTGRPQDLPEQTIGASYGDALLAARAVSLAEPDADWSRIVETVEPDEANRELYDELYGVYRDLYPATRETSHRLADLQKGGGDVVA